ncbi:DUF2785 domain-containing protein [Bacillus infantis]|uniref:DUF2785 domain-containing protein n=1 Tax=Bacillus infantis TaxID=324767 RepID=UPI0013EADA24|nr:DUF2785 domain-containing protein [Bacillus infantis]
MAFKESAPEKSYKLKERLEELYDAALTESELMNLAKAMLEEIGSADPYLRDHLIYSSFARLIGEGSFSHIMLEKILAVCQDDSHLFYHLGAEGDDSVFTRSFSSLVLALVIQKDAAERFLSDQTVQYTYGKTLEYMKKEKDLRGYVQEKGWAHSMAHAADLLNELVRHPVISCSEQLLLQGMDVIFHCVSRNDGVYTDDEPERLIFPLTAIFEKSNENTLANKLNELSLYEEDTRKSKSDGNAYYHLRTNLMMFYKSLYFRLKWIDIFPAGRDLLEAHIRRLHIEVYGEKF